MIYVGLCYLSIDFLSLLYAKVCWYASVECLTQPFIFRNASGHYAWLMVLRYWYFSHIYMQGWWSTGRSSSNKTYLCYTNLMDKASDGFGKVDRRLTWNLLFEICCRIWFAQFWKLFHQFHHVNFWNKHVRGTSQGTLITVLLPAPILFC